MSIYTRTYISLSKLTEIFHLFCSPSGAVRVAKLECPCPRVPSEAARSGNLPLAQKVLAAGAKIDSKDSPGPSLGSSGLLLLKIKDPHMDLW